VLRDCALTPHWRYVVVSQRVYTPTSVSFEVLMVVNLKIMVFWDVTQYSLVDRYQHFTETYCLHLQERNTETAGSSEIFKPTYQHIQWAHPKDHNPKFKSVCPLPSIINDMIFAQKKRHCLLTLRVHAQGSSPFLWFLFPFFKISCSLS
jgi:hypothetical protein